MCPVTEKMIHETAETGRSTLIRFGEVNKAMLEVYDEVVRKMLEGEKAEMTRGGKLYGFGREDGGAFHSECFHKDYGFCIMSGTAYPPGSDGEAARHVLRLDGVRRLQEADGGTVTDRAKNIVEVAGDASRVLAWAWLIHRNFVDTRS